MGALGIPTAGKMAGVTENKHEESIQTQATHAHCPEYRRLLSKRGDPSDQTAREMADRGRNAARNQSSSYQPSTWGTGCQTSSVTGKHNLFGQSYPQAALFLFKVKEM